MKQLIPDHPAVGKTFEYTDDKPHRGKRTRRGIVTGVSLSYAVMLDVKTHAVRHGVKLYAFRLKPDDGSRAFWTRGMEVEKPKKKARVSRRASTRK